jgi:hypothetical protein
MGQKIAHNRLFHPVQDQRRVMGDFLGEGPLQGYSTRIAGHPWIRKTLKI